MKASFELAAPAGRLKRAESAGEARESGFRQRRISPPSLTSTRTPCCVRCGCSATRDCSSSGAGEASPLRGRPSVAPSSSERRSSSTSPAARATAWTNWSRSSKTSADQDSRRSRKRRTSSADVQRPGACLRVAGQEPSPGGRLRGGSADPDSTSCGRPPGFPLGPAFRGEPARVRQLVLLQAGCQKKATRLQRLLSISATTM
jgi:hypothetical protein